jgi:peptidoglycan/xylan/chitin deacetylase (PgdA/CDA1 family)
MLLKKINYRLRLLWIKTLLKLGMFSKLSTPKQPITRILVFHGIDTIGQTHYNSRFVSVHYFEKLLLELQKNYTFISLDDFYNQHFDASKNNLVLTFDDGLQNNIDFAIPVLEKLNIPATFFITSCPLHHEVLWPDFLDLVTYYTDKSKVIFDGKEYFKNGKNEFQHQGKTLNNVCKQLPFSTVQQLFTLFEEEWHTIKTKKLAVYWQLMSLEEAKNKLSNPLFSIGAHSVHHPNLAAIKVDEAEVELLQSKIELEITLGIPIHQFAFPFGAYTQELITLAKKVGYTQLLPLEYNRSTDALEPTLKNRFMINPHIGWKEQIYFIKKGGY